MLTIVSEGLLNYVNYSVGRVTNYSVGRGNRLWLLDYVNYIVRRGITRLC